MGIADQFGLYDIAAHVIPGVVVLSAAAGAVVGWGGDVPLPQNDFLLGTVVIVAAYLAGTLCQELGASFDGRLVKDRAWSIESQESRYLHGSLAKGNEAAPFLAPLMTAIHDRTGLDPRVPPDRTRAKDGIKVRETCFRACYAVVNQHGQPARAQMFKAISAFHESMAVASLLAALAAVAVLALPLLELAGLPLRPPQLEVLGRAGVALLLALGAHATFRRGYETFDMRFVREVYHAFYALARK